MITWINHMAVALDNPMHFETCSTTSNQLRTLTPPHQQPLPPPQPPLPQPPPPQHPPPQQPPPQPISVPVLYIPIAQIRLQTLSIPLQYSFHRTNHYNTTGIVSPIDMLDCNQLLWRLLLRSAPCKATRISCSGSMISLQTSAMLWMPRSRG